MLGGAQLPPPQDPPQGSRELDLASMQAVAALLAGLPLQPEESDRGDQMDAKSQMFLKYVQAKHWLQKQV